MGNGLKVNLSLKIECQLRLTFFILLKLIPVFVEFCKLNQTVILNLDHVEYKWCSLSEAKEPVVFGNQKNYMIIYGKILF